MPESRTGRFAPSPSGPLHLGNLRTALLAWLAARSAGARFALRIEDLDPQRSKPEHERSQREDLRALGLDWDLELPRQSERSARYREALTALSDQGRVYECFCTRAEIRAASRAPHGELPEGSYPGTCRTLSEAERARRRERSDRPPALRIDAQGARRGFEDGVHGHCERVIDDFVLWRGDVDVAAYNLAVAVDDSDQSIGEVVRGADLLDTTPRQLLLLDLLDLSAPAYAHVPLLFGHDGQRLAKRHGAVTLTDRVKAGERPAEVLARLARDLGLAGADETVSATELIDRFERSVLGQAASAFGD